MCKIDLKEIREKLGLSQEQLAKRMSVSLRTIQNYESGKVIPQTKYEIIREILQEAGGGNHQTVTGNQNQVSGYGDVSSGVPFDIHRIALEEIRAQRESYCEQISRLLSLLEKK